MAIDKAIYPGNPAEPLPLSEEELSELVEIDSPFTQTTDSDGVEVTENPDGSAIVDFDPVSGATNAGDLGFYDNLLDAMGEREANKVKSELLSLYREDRTSRRDWEQAYLKGIELLGMSVEDRTEPFDGACGVTHPLLAEAAVRFQSQAISEIFPESGPARSKLISKETPELKQQSVRAEKYLNYLLVDKIPDYREEMDRLLFVLPLAGSAFKKVYFNSENDEVEAIFVEAEDLVVPFGSTSLEKTPRITHVMRRPKNWLRKRQVSGFYSRYDLSDPREDEDDLTAKKLKAATGEDIRLGKDLFTILEIHADLDLPGFEHEDEAGLTGIALPYIVTIDKTSDRVLSIRRNYKENDPSFKKREHFVHYQYVPGFGFYGYGLTHLLGGITKGATSALRQLVDAGTYANIPAGFKTKQMRVTNDNTPIAPGEFRDVDVGPGTLRENLMPLPFKEPSTVLFNLLGSMVEEGRRFASLTDINVSNMNQEAPVGTTLALIERNMKVMSAIQGRLHRSMKHELRIISRLIEDHGPDEYPYAEEGEEFSPRMDFDGRVDVIPVSDPNAATSAQRIMKFEAAMRASQAAPQLYSHQYLHRQGLEAMEIPNADKIIPLEEDLVPLDPVTENMRILTMDPVKAFAHQDHESHIRVHMTGMDDPKIQQVLEQSPQAQASQSAMMSHITEHVAYKYRQEISDSLGVPLPPEGEVLPPEIEVPLSKMVADAANKLFNRSSAEMNQIENEEAAKDPILQLRDREMALKEQNAQVENELKMKRLELDMVRLQEDWDKSQSRIQSDETINAERNTTEILSAVIRAASETEGLENQERIALVKFLEKYMTEEAATERKQREAETEIVKSAIQTAGGSKE